MLSFKLWQKFDFAIHTVTCLHLFISIIAYIYACSYIYIYIIQPQSYLFNITPSHKNSIIKKQQYTISYANLITCDFFFLL